MDDLETLKDFYGHGRSSIHPLSGKQCCADPIIDIISTSAEYDTYKRLAFGFRKQKDTETLEKINVLKKNLTQTLRVKPNEKKVNSLQEEIDDLKNSFNKTRLRDIYQHC